MGYFGNECMVCYTTQKLHNKVDDVNICGRCLDKIMVSGIDYTYFVTNSIGGRCEFMYCQNTLNKCGDAHKARCDRCKKHRNVVFDLPVCQTHFGNKN